MRKATNWLIAALSLLFIASLCWGVIGQVARFRQQRVLESMFRRSYYSFVGSMDEIEVNLSKLLASSAPEQEVLLLTRVAKLAENGADALSGLPVDESSEKLMGFVTRLGDYCGVLAQRGAEEGRALSQEERQGLQSLLGRQAELNAMAQSVDPSGLLRLDFAGKISLPETVPLLDLSQVQGEIPMLIYDGPFSEAAAGEPKNLGEEQINEEIALSVAQGFIGPERISSLAIAESAQEGEIPAFTVEAETTDSGKLSLQISKQGGKVLWMSPESSPGAANLSAQECQQAAESFLRERGLWPMEAGYWQMYSGMIVFNFCALEDGIRLYPDLIKLQVSMESGKVIGFEAGNYWRNHEARQLPAAAVSQGEAAALAGEIEVENVRLALIPSAAGEKFCYEVRGSRGGETFLIYINAESGKTENILKLLLEADKE
ncbi:MAG: germination protein YpeB, partial [Christensenellaceae bacterium]|nr:germination protein YpeB [Christensenellaceae bacterium]